MEMAPIVAENDIVKTLKEAIEAELLSRGFKAGSMVKVYAELQKFYNDFRTGFFSGSALAEVTMNVQIKKKDNTIIYSKLISAEGANPEIMLSSGENAKIALDKALKNVVAKLFEDKSFIEAVFIAGRD
ncbi:lipoprotein [Candidatus Magnetoovum chiemensis]|nr:lipoprotein [Candidatus Magnetoovum chiemensis]